MIKDKYAAAHPRRTEIRAFDTIEASKVAEANQKLYINRDDGFIGTALKKDEFVSPCSDLDDIILFYRDGTYKIVRIADKLFVGETEKSKAEGKKAEIIHVAVYKKGDTRTIYNVVYRDGKKGDSFIKRFNVTSVTHDKEYDLTTGTPGSRIFYFSANPNGEAETIRVMLKPAPKLKKLAFDMDFADLMIKGRQSRGNLVTHHSLYRILLKSHGASTLGGRKVWFDTDVHRINYEEHGTYLGEFTSDDRILVILQNGDYYFTDSDLNNHYDADIQYIGKYDSNIVWTAVLYDADNNNFPYIKRFMLEYSNKRQNFVGDNKDSKLILLSSHFYPRIQITYGDGDSFREPEIIDVDNFIKVKGFKAKGKRLTTFTIGEITELEPTRFPEPATDISDNTENTGTEQPVDIPDPDVNKSDDEIRDEQTGQLSLF
jgi:topoisomerase-4 subunit A